MLFRSSEDTSSIRFNTAISSMMEFVNFAGKIKAAGSVSTDSWRVTMVTLTKLIAPFAPHLAEEIWEHLGQDGSVHIQAWPKYDPELAKDDVMTIVIQVNGKLKDEFLVSSTDAHAKDILERMAKEKIADKLDGMEIVKVVVVPAKLVNFVIR